MRLVLIDGGPAAGKNTLGTLLADKLRDLDGKAVILDLDVYVEEFNPEWIWENDAQKETDQLNARIDFFRDINKYLKENYAVIAVGERILTRKDVEKFVSKISAPCSIYLYHLSIPYSLRKERLDKRGPNSLIDLEKDQKERDEIEEWSGYVYENINSPEVDATKILSLIKEDKGLIA